MLARWIIENGHTAEHVDEVGLAGAEDEAIWSRAVSEFAVMVTKDEEFVAIRLRASDGPPVCWLRIGNATNPQLFAWIARVFPAMLAALENGETVVEVR